MYSFWSLYLINSLRFFEGLFSHSTSQVRICFVDNRKTKIFGLKNTVEYIAGKSFLFILLEEKLDLTLFCVRRSQNFISHTSLIFNVCPKRDTGASSTKVTRHLLLYALSSWWAGGFGQPVLCANRTFPKVAQRGKRTHDACLEGQVISLAYRERVFIFILGFYMMLYDA